MIKLQDFARQQAVSDRTIQKHLKKHEKELEGHFERKGPNGTWLDEYAQDYIRQHLLQQPVAVYDAAASALSDENKRLQQELTKAYERIANASEYQLALVQELAEQKLLAAKAESAEEKAATAEQEAKQAKEEIESLRAQLEQIATSRGLKRRKLLKQLERTKP